MSNSTSESTSKSTLERQADALLPTAFGQFVIAAYARNADEPMPHLAMIAEKNGNYENSVPLVRLHSECATGDVFHSRRCDCGEQLEAALRQVDTEGGVVVYLRQEGRGIGLINKLKAYRLQEGGLDTLHANLHLGFAADARTYEDAATILADLGIKKLRLLTNNPEKVAALSRFGFEIVERVPLVMPIHPENAAYFKTKRDAMGHLFEL